MRVMRLLILIFAIFLVFGKQDLFSEETGIDLYCFENAPYVLIGEISNIRDLFDSKDYKGLIPKIVEIKTMDVFKGSPLPKNISVRFELDKYIKDEGFVKGGKVLLFLGPSVEYYYTPILYGSVYFFKDADIGVWTARIKKLSSILYDNLPENILNEYGFNNLDKCKIFYKMAGGFTSYSGELALSGNGIAKVVIRQVSIKEPILVELKVSEEYIRDLISIFSRMDFFNIKYVENKTVKDAPWETAVYSYGKRSNTIEGYTETYATNFTDYYFSKVSRSLSKLLEYIIENKYNSAGKIYDFKDISQLNLSFEFLKKEMDSGLLGEKYKLIIDCKEKDKLIPYFISRIELQDDASWLQRENLVNAVRFLRYFTRKDLAYDDKFLYNSSGEEVQKVKAAWKNLLNI